jgi:hypothetical protein
MSSLESTITEQIISEIKKKQSDARQRNCPESPGNQFHDKSGKFSSKAKHGSRSLYFTCKRHGRSGRNAKALTDPRDTGRGPSKHSGKGSYRAYDNSKLVEADDDKIMISKDALIRVVILAMHDVLETFAQLDESSSDKVQALCNKHGYRKITQFLKIQNMLQKSASGDLYER